MKLLYLFTIICFFVLSSCALPTPVPQDENGILTITSNIFEEVINSYSLLMVAFYDPKSTTSVSLEPEFSEVAKIVSDDPSIKLGKFDATTDAELIKALQIRNFPTFFLFRKGFRILYSGGLVTNNMVEWLREKSASPTTEIASFEELQAFQVNHKGKTQIIGYFKNPNNQLIKDLRDASFHPLLENAKVAVTTNPEILEAQAEDNDFVIVNFPDENESQTYFYSPTVSLQDWLFENAFPLVGELTQNVQRYYFLKKPLCGLFLKAGDQELTADPLYSIFTRAVVPHKGRASFTYANGSLYHERLPKMGYKGSLPVIALSDFNTQKTAFLPLNPEKTRVSEVQEWIGGVLDGKIKPARKSAPIPEKNDGPVTIVVGDTFDELVLDPTKDVLLEIYAPWCGHCKQLAPIYDKLGQVFSKYDTVRIAKIDGTENDHNVPNIQGYPTILFFPANDKKIPLLFKGERTLKDLEAFVRDSVSLPLPEKIVKEPKFKVKLADIQM